jgi:hypothetical protein
MDHLTPDIIYSYPLILVMEDCYVPESACAVIGAFIGVDEESAAVTIKLMAVDAERQLTNN